MRRSIVLAVAFVALLAAGCAGRTAGESGAATAAARGIPEERIGLAEARLDELPPLAAYPGPLPEAGEAPAVPAPFDGAPPVIPHAVDDFLPVTRDENLCLDCHLVDEKVPGEPTPIPADHYTDLRNAPDVRGDGVTGTRWYCVSCHVAPTGAPLLVENDFGEN